MAKLLIDLKNSLWFVPALIVSCCAALALGAVELDSIVGDDALSRFPRLFGAGAEGARQLLSSIAGSTITVTGVVFSITIVALSLAAAQYSPRVLRNFMSDRANQTVLGVFVGVYVYCLLVLRTVRGGDESFVPGISIAIALALALVGIGFLIFFIHHVALSIQVSQIAARIYRDTVRAIDGAYPKPLADACEALAEPDAPHYVTSEETGYVQQIDSDRLAKAAAMTNRVVLVEKATGDFVIEGQPLARISGEGVLEPELASAVRSAYAINTYRDIGQDPGFGVQQLVDIALKALSPGVNDIGTARNVLHYIGAAMCDLACRAIEEDRQVLSDGRLALVKRGLTFEGYLDAAFGAIRRDASERPDMVMQLLSMLSDIRRATPSPARRAVVTAQVQAIGQALDGARLTDIDRTAVLEALGAARDYSPARFREPVKVSSRAAAHALAKSSSHQRRK